MMKVLDQIVCAPVHNRFSSKEFIRIEVQEQALIQK